MNLLLLLITCLYNVISEWIYSRVEVNIKIIRFRCDAKPRWVRRMSPGHASHVIDIFVPCTADFAPGHFLAHWEGRFLVYSEMERKQPTESLLSDWNPVRLSGVFFRAGNAYSNGQYHPYCWAVPKTCWESPKKFWQFQKTTVYIRTYV